MNRLTRFTAIRVPTAVPFDLMKKKRSPNFRALHFKIVIIRSHKTDVGTDWEVRVLRAVSQASIPS